MNIHEFVLRVFDDKEQIALQMRVIVGKAYRHRTPVFEDSLESVIVRPWWNVPLSIQRNEMVPEIRSNLGYLRENKLHVVSGKSQSLPLPSKPEHIDGLVSVSYASGNSLVLRTR